MPRLVLAWIVLSSAASAQIPDAPNDTVAGIPVNYTEANAGSYTLPDLLKTLKGKPVQDAKAWTKTRRPEILKLVQDNWFGRAPARPKHLTFHVFDKATPAFQGKAIRRQITIRFTKDPAGPYMDLLLYLPALAKVPVPVFLNMSFFANHLAVSDTGVKVGRRWDPKTRTHAAAEAPAQRPRFRGYPLEQFLDAGIAFATFSKDDLAPDFPGSEAMGVKALFLKPGQPKPAEYEWGAIAAWAWGASRALDYLETDPAVDARRVVIHGVSRLGKTALWAGAADPRFAMVIASCSGEGGAALARRNYGETLAHMAAPSRFPYQFAPIYAGFAARVSEWPVDAHMLLALIAPRPLLLQTGNTDKWSDPYGEFLAAQAAAPVYQLLGKKPLGVSSFPAAGQAVLNDIGYFLHDGGHGNTPADHPVYIQFIRQHLVP